MKFLACLLFAAVGSAVVASAQSTPRPTGVFCSCPPTNSFSSSFVPSVAAQPFVDGFLVRVAWADLETAPGVFDWSLLDAQIQLCQQAGKKVALGVVQGNGTPGWLGQLGAAIHTYTFQGQQRAVAIPWDATYLLRWQSFIAALGARYATDTTIALVHATHATHNGFEMHLPFSEEQAYVAAGYSDAVYAASWQMVLDAFLAAFPNHPVDCDLHPIWGSDAVAQQVVAHGLAFGGDRFGVFGGWWSERNAQDSYPGMQALFQSTAPVTFANAQNVGSWVTTPTRYGSDLVTYGAAYELAMRTGIRYLEVWNADLLDPGLATMLGEVHAQVNCASWYQHYPDAANPGGSVLDIDGCIEPGLSFQVTVDAGPPNGIAVIHLGAQRGSATVPGVGEVLIAPLAQLQAFQVVSLDPAGQGSITVQSPASLPLQVTAQALVIDGGGSGLSLSNALEVR